MGTRKLFLNHTHFTETEDGYVYVPSSKIVKSFENLNFIRFDKMTVLLSTEPENGTILVESENISRM